MAATEPSSGTQAAQKRSDNAGDTARQGAPLLPQVLPPPLPIAQEKNGVIFQQQPAPVPLGYGGTYQQPYLQRAHGSEIVYNTRWHIVKLVFQTISVICSACIFGIGLALGAYSRQWGALWEIDILFSVLASAVCAAPICKSRSSPCPCTYANYCSPGRASNSVDHGRVPSAMCLQRTSRHPPRRSCWSTSHYRHCDWFGCRLCWLVYYRILILLRR